MTLPWRLALTMVMSLRYFGCAQMPLVFAYPVLHRLGVPDDVLCMGTSPDSSLQGVSPLRGIIAQPMH